MSGNSCAVTVQYFPEKVNIDHARIFIRELEAAMDRDRPCIVFDCSRNLHMDRPAVELLLHCLEEAMKRNGDIKLAAISENAGAILEATGACRLFEVFDASADAVSSYHRLPLHGVSLGYAPLGTLHQSAEDAA